MKWISVKDRLPDKTGRYLICVEGQSKKNMYIAIFYNGSFCRWPEEHAKVTHWMPLPEFPKGENSNEC